MQTNAVDAKRKGWNVCTGPRRSTQRIAVEDHTDTGSPSGSAGIALPTDNYPSSTPPDQSFGPAFDSSTYTPATFSPSNTDFPGSFPIQPFGSSQRGPSWGGLLHTLEPPQGRDVPLEGVQEACLLRYFIEDLSPSFDLVDPQRRYQLIVPERARRYPPLLNAILAMSARHLSRLQKYKTHHGIVYRGQLLPNLTPGTAVEYMLKCIQVLKDFHTTQDGEIRELIVTTAVILRHFEELDDQDSESGTEVDEGVNFLAILNAVLRSLTADDLSHRRELLNASYWIALRQEVYYALLKGFAPQIVEPPAEWVDISPANKLVSHTNQVAKWLFSDKSGSGWQKLKEQEEYLDEYVTGRFAPILYRPPDKVSGEVFPTMWFASPIALTGMQHMMIAKMILLAESPLLSRAEDVRAAYRNAEGDVRNLVLEVCGTAVQHPDTQPGLVNATLAIQIKASCEYPWADGNSSLSTQDFSWVNGAFSEISNILMQDTITIPQPLSPAMAALLDGLIDTGEAALSLSFGRPPGPPLSLQPEGAIPSSGRFQARTEYVGRRIAAQGIALAQTGHTAFIHHSQVAASPVLQDALAGSSLHAMRNPANADIVKREVARRAALLIQAVERLLVYSPTVRLDILPPVQALPIYQSIRLFSTIDISQQAQAERDATYLSSWAAKLRDELRPFTTPRDWTDWVRQESVRRTVLFVEVITGVYRFLKLGWDTGEREIDNLCFTAQAALWEARSKVEWEMAWTKYPRLEATMSTFRRDTKAGKADDFEEMGIIFRATFTGLEALERWLGGDRDLLRKWGLREQTLPQY
ncbi:hypothetical protein LB507_008630 [Fusarium sp. FIESC RH6]|nr:hypothetical protein LB507_008630 [Fusarium sp. FIESC RH6]